MYFTTLLTPLGRLLIKATNTHVYTICFDDLITNEHPNLITDEAKTQLVEYFDSKRHKFSFPILQNGTDFQQTVWKQILNIEAGKPVSYARLSKTMNKPLAIRAIAAANAKNKLLIAVPCHRVIGSTGMLVGYAAELWRKKWLLAHETKLTGIGQSTLIF